MLVASLMLALLADPYPVAVAEEAYKAGAVVGNDISGFSDVDYLPVSARAGATVIATREFAASSRNWRRWNQWST